MNAVRQGWCPPPLEMAPACNPHGWTKWMVFRPRIYRVVPLDSEVLSIDLTYLYQAEPHRAPRPRWCLPRKALRGGISKSILQRPCQFLAINAHKMAPTTTRWLQERPWNAPTKGLLWIGFWVSGPGFRVSDSVLRVAGFVFRVSSFGFRVPGSGIQDPNRGLGA